MKIYGFGTLLPLCGGVLGAFRSNQSWTLHEKAQTLVGGGRQVQVPFQGHVAAAEELVYKGDTCVVVPGALRPMSRTFANSNGGLYTTRTYVSSPTTP